MAQFLYGYVWRSSNFVVKMNNQRSPHQIGQSVILVGNEMRVFPQFTDIYKNTPIAPLPSANLECEEVADLKLLVLAFCSLEALYLFHILLCGVSYPLMEPSLNTLAQRTFSVKFFEGVCLLRSIVGNADRTRFSTTPSLKIGSLTRHSLRCREIQRFRFAPFCFG